MVDMRKFIVVFAILSNLTSAAVSAPAEVIPNQHMLNINH
jgi:hypothetical protein